MTQTPKRRQFLQSATILSGAVSVLANCSNELPSKKKLSDYPSTLPESLPKGLEYVLKVRDMVKLIIEEDFSKIQRAANICADTVASGNKVYYSILGHNAPQCILETKPGRPSFLLPLNPKKTSLEDTIKPGDVLISVRTDQCSLAIEMGAHAIGILMPFQPQKTQGQGFVYIDYEGPYMEDICDVCIWDRTPYTVGIIDFEQFPWKSLSAHGALDGMILGLIIAATTDILIERGIPIEPAK